MDHDIFNCIPLLEGPEVDKAEMLAQYLEQQRQDPANYTSLGCESD
jgi:hypothetical protein